MTQGEGVAVADHGEGLALIRDALAPHVPAVAAVGHRVVHGGASILGPTLATLPRRRTMSREALIPSELPRVRRVASSRRTRVASEGTELEVEVRNKRLPAKVTKLPFVPHRYHRGN